MVEIKLTELIEQLNQATEAYDRGTPIMSDKDWDTLYFALVKYENETGDIRENSPTRKIHYDVVNQLNKVEHNHAMLSLDKTKDFDTVNSFVGNQPFICMCKMDGLTCSLTYKHGLLVGAETRGNGLVGEDILHNMKHLPSVPKDLHNDINLVVDGEIICKYNDFAEFAAEYKNPRNFAAGSIRLLNAKESAARKLTFVAWDLIEGSENDSFQARLKELFDYGFTVVPRITAEKFDADVQEAIQTLASYHHYPIDGVVIKFDSVSYGKSLGQTEHHFKNAIAFKFYDETYPTVLKNIEWTMGRTGVLTPVAIFEPVDIDGSIVERASLHNVSIMQETLGKQPWVGQKIEVFKANMIIPQIASSEIDDMVTPKEYLLIPQICTVCGHPALIEDSEGGTRNLVCINKNCDGKLINKLDHFCGKKGLDIKGLSKATLEKLIDWGWVSSPTDIFRLSDYKKEWINKPGFGEKSVMKILTAIEDSRSPQLDAFISSIGIPLIGKTVSKELVKHISSYEEFREKINNHFDFSEYDGFADNKTSALWNYDYTDADEVYKYLTIQEQTEETVTNNLDSKTFVITGKLKQYKNRAELQAAIEQRGGKVTGSVSKNTTALINNDNTSSSAKNLSAQKLGIKVLTEEEFIATYLT